MIGSLQRQVRGGRKRVTSVTGGALDALPDMPRFDNVFGAARTRKAANGGQTRTRKAKASSKSKTASAAAARKSSGSRKRTRAASKKR